MTSAPEAAPGPRVAGSTTSLGVWFPVVAGAGLVAGWLSKVADESGVPALGDLTSYLGLWVVLVTVVAVRAGSRSTAALSAAVFLVAMTVAYYAAAVVLLGSSPVRFAVLWVGIALTLGPSFAAVIHGRLAPGWREGMATALPVGVLLWEAASLAVEPSAGDHTVMVLFDGCAAVVLLATMPRSDTARIAAALLAPAFSVAALVFVATLRLVLA